FALAVIALLAALGAALLGGDRAGVAVTHIAPAGTAHLTTPLRFTFGEAMDAASVEAHFLVDPPVEGRFAWSGAQMTFQPGWPWSPDTTYTATLKAGARSASGRLLTEDAIFTFHALPPKLAYLAPAVAETNVTGVTNLWLLDPSQSDAVPQQVTFSRTGIEDFQPAPDGERIAFTLPGPGGLSDLYLVDLPSGETRALTNCAAAQATCRAPSWSPDGQRLVYERQEKNPDLPALERAAPRAWVVRLDDLSTAPLVDDPTALGGAPHWSPDGARVAVFDLSIGGVVVYDAATGGRVVVPGMEAQSGDFAFSPDGTDLAYPQLVDLGGRFTSHLELIALDRSSPRAVALTGQDNPRVEDRQPTWQPGPDGARLTFTRRSLDGANLPTAQIYALDPDNRQIEPLIVDAAYFHGGLAWDPRGEWLAFQRVRAGDPDPRPQVWLFDAASGEMRLLVENAYAPRWIP
ncbi:MAG: PD40 domain-containing protein, partial [Anaerolineae bacterium]|nr:PD40 domain-containing protein [Anaerolineae bacterium]